MGFKENSPELGACNRFFNDKTKSFKRGTRRAEGSLPRITGRQPDERNNNDGQEDPCYEKRENQETMLWKRNWWTIYKFFCNNGKKESNSETSIWLQKDYPQN